MSKEKEYAILMAAGLGTRMRPLTLTTPKPLIKVHGEPMIETVINGLIKRGICEIYIVTGYLGEQFSYLKNKYDNVFTIENTQYNVKNNISSIYAARDVLRKGSCFICESDLYVSDNSIFLENIDESCYYAKMVKGHSEDWVFDVEDGYISRVGKVGDDCFNMVGVAYFKEKEAGILADLIEKAGEKSECDDLFWDDIVDRNLDKLKLKVHQVPEAALVEIDTVEELNLINAE